MTESDIEWRRPTVEARLDAGPVEYRLEPRGDRTVLILHGGHMHAGLAIGEDVFTDLGYGVLVPSRPGYGKTPLTVGRSPSEFASVVQQLCDHLAIKRLAAVVGISAGGPTALAMAAGYPQLVERLILQSAVGLLSWPNRRTRLAAHLVFNPITEKFTWRLIHAVLRSAPSRGLRFLLRDLSTRPVNEVLAALSDHDRTALLALFSGMRSHHGFLNDLRHQADVTAPINQPTLIIASRHDGAVPLAHAQSLAARISQADLVVSQADSHLIWFGAHYAPITDRIQQFLGSKPAP